MPLRWRSRRASAYGSFRGLPLGLVGLLTAAVLWVTEHYVLPPASPQPPGAPFTSPAFATAALSAIGLVALFVGMLHQRRFQRADDLVRELVVLREQLHPDYRSFLSMPGGWADEGLDPRWREKHEQTVQALRRFREYRQLFVQVPPYVRRTATVFGTLAVITVAYWVISYLPQRSPGPIGWLHLVALAISIECLWHLVDILRRVALFSASGINERLHETLGIPSWYTLLDCRYLAGRCLPVGPLLAALECYVVLKEAGSEWVVSLQLPLPLRSWEWRCQVLQDGEALGPFGEWRRVELAAAAANRFFEQPGLWLEEPVAPWPPSVTAPDEIDRTRQVLEVPGADRPGGIRMIVDAGSAGGKSGWYHGRQDANAPHHYPYWRYEMLGDEQALPEPRLIRPDSRMDAQ